MDGPFFDFAPRFALDKLKQQFDSARAGLKSTQAELKNAKSAASASEGDLKENMQHLEEELKEAKAEIGELLKVLLLFFSCSVSTFFLEC